MMQIAILMTNTDESDFSQRWPKDGEKFPAMMRKVRPDWDYRVYAVKDGVFPQSLAGIDGVMITGSPASVNSGEAWVDRLFALIREIDAAQIPMFGACFGHQAIAKALGGDVTRNPNGWVFGLVEARYRDGTVLPLYASHAEQVSKLPKGGEVLSEGPDCGIAGFVVGPHIMTTQYHPEMEPEFIAALVEHLADELPEEVTQRARASLVNQADMLSIAERIALFLEGNQSSAAKRSSAVT